MNFQGIHLKFCTQRPENIILDMFRFFNPIHILKISKISNKLRQQFENAFVLSFSENQSVLCLKTVCLPAFLVNPYFWPKPGKHDATVTSFTADPSELARFPLVRVARSMIGNVPKFSDDLYVTFGDITETWERMGNPPPPRQSRIKWLLWNNKR